MCLSFFESFDNNWLFLFDSSICSLSHFEVGECDIHLSICRELIGCNLINDGIIDHPSISTHSHRWHSIAYAFAFIMLMIWISITADAFFPFFQFPTILFRFFVIVLPNSYLFSTNIYPNHFTDKSLLSLTISKHSTKKRITARANVNSSSDGCHSNKISSIPTAKIKIYFFRKESIRQDLLHNRNITIE